MLSLANVIWGARCGKSARRVLLGETRSRRHAYSVRRRRESALWREAPHGLPSSRLVSTILLDLWFEEEVRPRLKGNAKFVRYADDGVFGFELEEDARRVQAVLGKRLQRFGLTLHPDKTRLLDFSRPPSERTGGRSPTTFDFLGFTWYWRKVRGERWSLRCKTRRARLARAIRAIHLWCKEHRHVPVREQHAALTRRVQGHINYFGVSGNTRSLRKFMHQVRRRWFKWLCRRSQRTRLNWAKFLDLVKVYPLPKVRIVVPIWGC